MRSSFFGGEQRPLIHRANLGQELDVTGRFRPRNRVKNTNNRGL